MKRIAILAFFCELLTLSCDKGKDYTIDPGYSFFPIDSGYTWVYHVDSFYFNDLKKNIDTFLFFEKVQVSGYALNQQQEKVWRLKRWKSKTDSSDWSEMENHFLRKSQSGLILNKNGKEYLKLAFPLLAGKTWNGNIYNNLGKEEYLVEALNGSSLIKIWEANELNFIADENVFVIYSKDTGPSFISDKRLSFQGGDTSGTWVKYKLQKFHKQ